MQEEKIIAGTQRWIERVIIPFQICPFAAKVFNEQTIHYQAVLTENVEKQLLAFHEACQQLDEQTKIETTFLIFPYQYNDFDAYLDFVELAQTLLNDSGYEGIYQIATFHPEYQFAGSSIDDPANYTNRSLYPMIHLLREESVEKALEFHDDPASIPERNIAFAQEQGLEKMQKMRDECW